MTAPQDWKEFVIAHGGQARVDWLAFITGIEADEIRLLRQRGVCVKRPHRQGKGFAELFSAWHGRAPEDHEWPAPRFGKGGGGYEWLTPELTLLASLVGRLSRKEIAEVLTQRLRQVTGDPQAERSLNAVQLGTSRIGLQTSDLVGGISVKDAAAQTGSSQMIYSAINEGLLQASRVGHRLLITRESLEAFLAKRQMPPEGYVMLSTLKQPLGIRSDKLSEWARAGQIPNTVRCNPFGSGHANTQYGTWWIDEATAKKIIADRHMGRPMPWHLRSDLHNLKTTWKLLQERLHPTSCSSCQQIWGPEGAPQDFDDYCKRYPPLAHGAKRHLTRVWSPGLTLSQVAQQCGCELARVELAVASGALRSSGSGAEIYVSQTDTTLWMHRKCPDGSSHASWTTLTKAAAEYGFELQQLQAWMADGTLKSRAGSNGEAEVLRNQCRHRLNAQGFTEADAARRLGVQLPRMRELLRDLDWRGDGRITLDVLNAMAKRLESKQGYTLEEAAQELQQPLDWVRDRIRDGTIRVARTPADRRRLYVTGPMMKRLRQALAEGPAPARLTKDWISVGRAAVVAGVSTTTMTKWYSAGEVVGQETPSGIRLQVESVRERARRYWKTSRYIRDERPAWLVAEAAGAQA